MTSNISESINKVFKGEGEPIVVIAQSYRDKLKKWFVERQEAASATFMTLSASAEKLLRVRAKNCGTLVVRN